MKSGNRFLDVFATFILMLALLMPLSARVTSSPAPVVIKQNTTGVNAVDLDNPPLLTKYAHGFKVGPINHNILPAGPIEPKAHQLFFEAQTFQQKGFAYLMYGCPEQAIVSLNKAHILWPDSAATYRWLAEAYEADGHPSLAIANYRLLFYGWPNRNSLADTKNLKSGKVPADKPSDYNTPDPEITDPTLLMQFSLLLQQAGQEDEARTIFEREDDEDVRRALPGHRCDLAAAGQRRIPADGVGVTGECQLAVLHDSCPIDEEPCCGLVVVSVEGGAPTAGHVFGRRGLVAATRGEDENRGKQDRCFRHGG